MPGALQHRLGLVWGGLRQSEVEACAAAYLAFCPHPSSMGLDDASSNVKAKTLVTSVPGIPVSAETNARLEDHVQLLGRNARTLVAHADAGLVPLQPHPDGDEAAWRMN